MKKSTRALLGLVVIDLLLLSGTAYLVMTIEHGASLTVPPEQAISTVTSIGGGAIGIVTAILLLASFWHRRRGN
jgi:hypothetical protein